MSEIPMELKSAFLVLILLLAPLVAWAVEHSDKTPEMFPIITYAWVVVLSIAGGAASFYSKYKRHDVRIFNFTEFIGEMFVASFCGVITFYLCEYLAVDGTLEAVFVAMSGHAGSRGLFWLEHVLQKHIEARLGVNFTQDGKHDDHE